MKPEFLQYRRWKLTAHDQQMVFIHGRSERTTHVLMKAFLWALYVPQYSNMAIEVRVGDRYKPDVVAVDAAGSIVFWGESGKVSPNKIHALAKRYRHTHIVVAKWAMRLDPMTKILESALDGVKRQAPFDLLSFPPDSAERFLDDDGNIRLRHDDLEAWLRFGPTQS